MRLVTWNVNSLNVRLPRVLQFLDQHAPDVLCLQETKCEAAAFPVDQLAAAGYHAAAHSAGRWAGVAIAARADLPITDEVRGLPGEAMPEEARWLEATVGGLRVCSTYVTNGRAVGTPTFDEKLRFLDAIATRAATLRAGAAPVVVAGDFNVAPADADVYDPVAFQGSTHVTAAERDRLRRILDAGYVDAYRRLHPDEPQFTWWDYRQGHFHRGMGLRIDLALLSTDLESTLVRTGIARDYRKGTKPSDHAPLIVELEGA